jgi:hypothetical protein
MQCLFSSLTLYDLHYMTVSALLHLLKLGIGRLKRDGYCAETSFRLSVNRTSPFESAGLSAHTQSFEGSSNAGLTMTCLSFTIDGLPTPLACFPLAQASLRIDQPSRSNRAIIATYCIPPLLLILIAYSIVLYY